VGAGARRAALSATGALPGEPPWPVP